MVTKTNTEKASAKKRASKARPAKPGSDVLVRMYCQGLGDCFLLRFPAGKRFFNVLIDCGVIIGTPKANDRLKLVIDDIVQVTDGEIDLLIGTHEHWDHLSGFVMPDPGAKGAKPSPYYFANRIAVKQTWLGWTENLKDLQAKRLADDRKAKRNSIARAAEDLKMRLGTDDLAVRQTASILGFFGIDIDDPATTLGAAAGADKTGEAMDWLRTQNPTYCEPGEVKVLPGVAGVKVFVLGPPRDEVQLMRSLPGKREEGTVIYKLGDHLGLERLLRIDGGPDPNREDRRPFEAKYRIAAEDAARDGFFQLNYYDPDDAWRRIDGDFADDLPRMALKLDSATNNTSLALAFQLPNGKVLLFPGDAQVGNWESWHASSKGVKRFFSVGGGHETAEELLNRTVLYKVGHHGSHNATLKERGLESMPDELIAMIPCEVYTAHEKKHWNKMPFVPMVDALREKKAGIVQADDKVAAIQTATPGPAVMKALETIGGNPNNTRPVTRPLYYEYAVEMK